MDNHFEIFKIILDKEWKIVDGSTDEVCELALNVLDFTDTVMSVYDRKDVINETEK